MSETKQWDVVGLEGDGGREIVREKERERETERFRKMEREREAKGGRRDRTDREGRWGRRGRKGRDTKAMDSSVSPRDVHDDKVQVVQSREQRADAGAVAGCTATSRDGLRT